MSLRHIAACALISLCGMSLNAAQPMTRGLAREIIDERGVDPVSGIWRIGGDGALVAVLPADGNSAGFDIYLLDSPDMSVMPGDKIGSATATDAGEHYDAELLNGQGFTRKHMRYIFTLKSDGHMEIRPYKKGKKIVGLHRWLPYLFRISVNDYDTRPSGVDGAVKIYPAGLPRGPIML